MRERSVKGAPNWPVLGIHRGCGGTVRVTDYETHNEWRYESCCTKCWGCDPNGYGSKVETAKMASEYFGIDSPTPTARTK